MTESHESLSERLLDAAETPDGPTEEDRESTFERLLAVEGRFEARIRRVALATWAIAFVALVTTAAAIGTIRSGSEAVVESARLVLFVAIVVGLVSLFAAALTSFQWLFRAHTPTLRAIERRLAALEERLSGSTEALRG